MKLASDRSAMPQSTDAPSSINLSAMDWGRFPRTPQVPHHYNHIKIPLVAGMTFTIEPMINAGVALGIHRSKRSLDRAHHDGKPSAQWEHTLLITEEWA